MTFKLAQFMIAGMAWLGAVQPGSAATFIVDTDRSFVTATRGVWIPTPILDLVTLEPSGMVEWRAERVDEIFSLSGMLDVSSEPAVYRENAARVSIDHDGLISDAPSSVGFSMASAFLQYGSQLENRNDPCFGSGFDQPPNIISLCTGFSMPGYGAASEGTLENGVLTLTGYRENGYSPIPLSLVLPEGSESPTDGADFNGWYTYELYAVAAVPEPTSMIMMLVGVSVVGAVARRNRVRENPLAARRADKRSVIRRLSALLRRARQFPNQSFQGRAVVQVDALHRVEFRRNGTAVLP